MKPFRYDYWGRQFCLCGDRNCMWYGEPVSECSVCGRVEHDRAMLFTYDSRIAAHDGKFLHCSMACRDLWREAREVVYAAHEFEVA